MKITRISRAKEYRVFRDFAWSADLYDFARFNLIYGWNGTGKTTLSTLFRYMQQRKDMKDGQVDIVVDQARISSADFSTAVLPSMRVFNRDSIDRNIFEIANQHFPPVFYLGEDSAEKQRQIEEWKKEEQAKIAEALLEESRKADATTALESFCAEEAKGIKNLLTVPGGGPFNNYNASNFRIDAGLQAVAARKICWPTKSGSGIWRRKTLKLCQRFQIHLSDFRTSLDSHPEPRRY